MDSLDTGKDKIKKICEVLKNETLAPAKQEAATLIKQAEAKARMLIDEAEKKAEVIITNAHAKNEKEREVFETSLRQACQQGTEELKQNIESKLLNEHLASWVENQTSDPKVGAKLIKALVGAIEDEGTSANFSAAISKTLSTKEVNSELTKSILDALKEKSVVVGEFMGGVQLKLHEQQLTLDVSAESIQELLKSYLHKDFRDIVFKS